MEEPRAAFEKLVGEVNAEFISILDEMQRHGENPRLVRLVEQLVRLTADKNAAPTQALKLSPPTTAVTFTAPVPPVQITACWHNGKVSNGICELCGRPVFVASTGQVMDVPQGHLATAENDDAV